MRTHYLVALFTHYYIESQTACQSLAHQTNGKLNHPKALLIVFLLTSPISITFLTLMILIVAIRLLFLAVTSLVGLFSPPPLLLFIFSSKHLTQHSHTKISISSFNFHLSSLLLTHFHQLTC